MTLTSRHQTKKRLIIYGCTNDFGILAARYSQRIQNMSRHSLLGAFKQIKIKNSFILSQKFFTRINENSTQCLLLQVVRLRKYLSTLPRILVLFLSSRYITFNIYLPSRFFPFLSSFYSFYVSLCTSFDIPCFLSFFRYSIFAFFFFFSSFLSFY